MSMFESDISQGDVWELFSLPHTIATPCGMWAIARLPHGSNSSYCPIRGSSSQFVV